MSVDRVAKGVSRTAVEIMAQLYEAQELLREFHGDAYPAKIAEFRPILEAAGKEHGSLLHGLMAIMRENQKLGMRGKGPSWLAMATFVEMTEGKTP